MKTTATVAIVFSSDMTALLLICGDRCGVLRAMHPMLAAEVADRVAPF
jgi:hypothetical protein